MSTPYLSAKAVPSGTEFPGTVQGLVNLLAQYIAVAGIGGAQSINYGSTTPLEENRDKPWFKTSALGAPIGWFSWGGTAWDPTPVTSNVGTTANRPFNPGAGTQYFDTTINCMVIFERSKWRTLAGSPGDIKFVAKQTLAEAITQNPGWIEYVDASGRVIGAAGSGSGLTEREYGEKVGTETVTLNTSQIPAHTHGIGKTPQYPAPHGVNTNGSAEGFSRPVTVKTATDSTGDGEPHDNMQPTLFMWCLIKE